MSRYPSALPGKTLVAAALAALVLPSMAFAQPPGDSPQQRAQSLLDSMTLEQKIQQLSNKPEETDFPSGTYLASGNKVAQCGFTAVGRRITGIPELGIPTFREINGGNGVRGGDCVPEPVRTAGPSMTLAAASFDPELVQAWGEVVGEETRSFAHQVLLGPALNLIRSPYAGRAQEYPGEDPFLAGTIGSAQIRGIQSQGVQAMAKHFAGNEHEFQFERWTAGVRIPSRAMHELYLLPFEMAVKDGGIAGVMCAYPHLNGEWACDSEGLLVDTLRKRWGFDGWIETDRLAMHSTVQSMNVGVSYELAGEPDYYSRENILAAIDEGEITEEDIDRVLGRRYAKMFEFGQFEDPFDSFVDVDLEENAVVARQLAEGGVTLLKNADGILPLNAGEVQSIALIGHEWFAGSATIPPRNGDPRELTTVVPPFTVSPEEGLSEYVGSVTYNDGTDLAAAAALAAASDVVVVMVGTTPRETRDLLSIRLPELCGTTTADPDIPDPHEIEDTPPPAEPVEVCLNQEELIRQVSAANPNTIVVLYSGAGIVMDWLDLVPALIAGWFPGQEDGKVMADILFGTVNPSGKLPVTFPVTEREAAFATEAQYPGLREDTGIPGGPGRTGGDPNIDQLISNYSENLEMGYRWYEANNVTPVFPFGHGLSYTTFEYDDLRIRQSVRREYSEEWVADKGRGKGKGKMVRKLKALVPVVTVQYRLTNTGERAGAEASQVYLTLPRQARQPAKRLVGFEKVFLEPGESRRVSVTIDAGASNHPFSYFSPRNPQDLAAWAEGRWVSPDGQYRISVGGSSADTPLSRRVSLNFDRGPGNGHGHGPGKPHQPERPERPDRPEPDVRNVWAVVASILAMVGWER